MRYKVIKWDFGVAGWRVGKWSSSLLVHLCTPPIYTTEQEAEIACALLNLTDE